MCIASCITILIIYVTNQHKCVNNMLWRHKQMLWLNKINPFEKYMEIVNVRCFNNNYSF